MIKLKFKPLYLAIISFTIYSEHLIAADTILTEGSTITGGIQAVAGDTITVDNNGSVRVNQPNGTSSSDHDNRANVSIHGGSVNLGSNSTVNSFGGWSTPKMSISGVSIWNSGSSFEANNLTIDMISDSLGEADAVTGIGAIYSTNDTAGNSVINLTGKSVVMATTHTDSYLTAAVYVDGNKNKTSFKADELNITAQNQYDGTYVNPAAVYGIAAMREGNSIEYNKATISTSSISTAEAVGIISNSGTINGNETYISVKGAENTTGQSLKGIESSYLETGDADGIINLTGTTSINVSSYGGNTATLKGFSVLDGGQITQNSGSIKIVLDTGNNDTNIVYGLYTSGNGTININTDSLNIINRVNTSDQSNYIYNKGGTTNINVDSLALNNSDGLPDTTKGVKDAIVADTNGRIDITSTQTQVTGNLIAKDNGLIDFNAGNGSLSGMASSGNGTINMNLTNNLVWNMTDNSQVSDLTLSNSTVKFNNDNFETLTTGTLQGNGLFDIRTDIVGQQGDLIVVNGTAEGNHQLKITNNGSAATNGTETLTVVQTGAGSTATFGLANNVELGGYQYGLREKPASATDFELYSTGKTTSTADAATSFLNIGYLTTYIENQTLLQRLGDLRNSEAAGVKSDGFWMKGFGGKLSAFSGSQMKGFDMTYTGTQLGIDKNIDMQDGRLLVGIMAGYTRTNPNYREGDGNGKNYTAGLYATYLNDNGIYVDNVLKYNSMHNQFNVKDTAGNAVKGKGKTQGIMLSTELGKRFWLESKQQGFYLEPQAQLSYGYQNGDTVHASNGLKVGLSHYNSTLGRISGIAGYQIQGENPINIYVKTGVVREMSGGASYRFNNGDKKGYSFRSSWFDNGIGANITINKQHNIYAEADYSTGGKFDNAMMNIGYRYSF